MRIVAFLPALALLAAAGAAQAEPSSTQIHLVGEIPVVCEVTSYRNATNAADIDLASTAERGLASLTYTCNAPAGFSRTIASENAGKLVNQDMPSVKLGYKVKHGGGSGLAFDYVSLASPVVDSKDGSEAFANGQTGSLQFKLDAPGKMAGVYKDTITVTIAANS